MHSSDHDDPGRRDLRDGVDLAPATRSEIAATATLLRGFALNQIIASTVRSDLTSLLARGARAPEELASFTGLPWERVRLLMVVLRELGFARQDDKGTFHPTPTTYLLDRDRGALGGQALLAASVYYQVWADLGYSLKTGESAFRRSFGQSFWEFLDSNPEADEYFSRTMGTGSALLVDPFTECYELPPTGHLVDVGAGNGQLIAGLLERCPGAVGTAVEMPRQVPRLRAAIEARGLTSRCRVVAADMFEELPPDGDVYLFKGVFHNWPDAPLVTMLQRLAADLRPGARVLVIERALPATTSDVSTSTAVNALTMLLVFGSTERTVEHYEQLLHLSDLTTTVVDVTNTGVTVIEGIKP